MSLEIDGRNIKGEFLCIGNTVNAMVDASQGTFFMAELENDEPSLNLIASYAFTVRKNVANKFRLKVDRRW